VHIIRLSIVLLLAVPLRAAELFTLTPTNYAACVSGGKEVDAIIGDYVLRNDNLVAVVADPRLMMGRSASRWAIPNVAGALIDLTTRDQSNDLLTAFYPASPRFKPDAPNYQYEFTDEAQAWRKPGREPVSAPRVTLVLPAYELDSGKSVEELEALPIHLRSLPKPRVEVRYILEDGWDAIRIETEYHNPTESPVEIAPFMSLRVDDVIHSGTAFDSRLFWVHDPWWQQAYGVATGDHAIQARAAKPPRFTLADLFDGKTSFTLPPGGRKTVVRHLTTGDTTQAVQRVAASLLQCPAPPAPAVDIRPPVTGHAAVTALDESGRPIPCRILYQGRDGTPDPFFFPATGDARVLNAVHAHTGASLDPLPPGRYDVTVSCGPEYTVFTQAVTVVTGQETGIRATLNRAYATPGWIAANLHDHSTRSGASEIFYVYPYSKDPTVDGDSTASPRGRVLSLLAAGIEFAVATEHNFSSTYAPVLDDLDCRSRMATCPGIGFTAGRRHTVTHQNVFPIRHIQGLQDGGVPQRPEHVGQLDWIRKWDADSERLFQIVVPRGNSFQVTAGMDALDVVDLDPVVEGKPLDGRDNRILDWLEKLNQGYRLPAVVNSGSFDNFTGPGRWRNYVKSSTDDPAIIDPVEVVREIKRGHVIMTSGPFLEVTATAGALTAGPGDSLAAADGTLTLHIRIQCADPGAVNRIQVLQNGRRAPELDIRAGTSPALFRNAALRFDHAIPLALTNDTILVIVASGAGVAVANPIRVDVGANGFLPRSPLDDTVTTKLDFLLPPLVQPDAQAPGRVRLALENTGDEPATGVARLEIVPASAARLLDPAGQSYSIPPKGHATLDWTLQLENAFIADNFPLRSTYNNASTFGVRVPRGPAGTAHFPASTFMALDYPMASLPPLAEVTGVADALRGERGLPITDADKKPLATCRWAISGSNLAVQVSVRDTRPERQPILQEGSCIELFGSLPGRSSQDKPEWGYFPIRQVFLLPGAGTRPAEAHKRNGEQILPAPEIRLSSTPVEGGYEIQALVPLTLLGADVDYPARSVFFAGSYTPTVLLGTDPMPGRILLEARVTAPRDGAQGPSRGTIFGSRAPHADHNAFGRFRLMGTVHAVLEVLEPLSLRRDAGPARVLLRLENRGSATAVDEVAIRTDPADAVQSAPSDRSDGSDRARDTLSFPFKLPPGAATSHVFTLTADKPPQAGMIPLVVPRSPGGLVAGIPSPSLPVVDRPIRLVPEPDTIAGIARALESETPFELHLAGQPAARIRIGLTPRSLLLEAQVTDARVSPQDPPWKGSCLEIFASTGVTNAIGHVFLRPASDKEPAAGLVPDDDQAVRMADIEVQSAVTATGYDMTARVPLRLLQLDANADRFGLELQLGASGADGKIAYGTVFNSIRAYMTSIGYGQFRVLRPEE
jgi:hypothetical protein